MNHDPFGCNTGGCPTCGAYLAGAEDVLNGLLQVLQYGRPASLSVCSEDCEHPRCVLVQMMDFNHRSVAAHMLSEEAEAWALKYPSLAAHLLDVLGDPDVKGDG